MDTTDLHSLYDKFYSEYHNKKFNEAIESLHSIQLLEGKRSFWIYSRLSSCFYELKDYEQAANYGRLSYKLQPKSPLVLWDYGGALIMAKKEKKAIKLLQRLTEMDDDLTKYGFEKPDRRWMQSIKTDANFLIGKAYYTICEDVLAKKYFNIYLEKRKRGIKTLYSKADALKFIKRME
jgi:tetratricopeptide (TPR) repeat protein